MVKSCFSEFLELGDGVDEVDVSEQHGPAAVSLEVEVVEDLLLVLAFVAAFLVLAPEVANRFPAAPASDWYDHCGSCRL